MTKNSRRCRIPISRIFVSMVMVLTITAFTSAAFGQIEVDTTHWNDEELYTSNSEAPAFFSIGAGVLASYSMPNFDNFNQVFVHPYSGPSTTIANHTFGWGGQGFVTLPWVKNLRVGGMGMSAKSDCGCTDTTVDAAKVGRFIDFEVGYGALTLDYVLPIRTGRFHIVPGIALGYGSVDIYARQSQTRDFNISQDFDAPTVNVTHTYSSNFFLYMPRIQFEYAPLGALMFRLSAGYQGTAMGTWTVDRGVSLSQTAPLDDISASGLNLSFGVFFGIFQ